MERNPLKWLIANRIGVMLITLVFVSLAVFAATEMLPGDVAEIILGPGARRALRFPSV